MSSFARLIIAVSLLVAGFGIGRCSGYADGFKAGTEECPYVHLPLVPEPIEV